MAILTFNVDTDKIMLSGSRRAFKTDGLISDTRRIASVDAFISRVAEGLFRAGFSAIGHECYSVRTVDMAYTLLFCGGAGSRAGEDDLIFYGFSSAVAYAGGVDRGLVEYMSAGRVISFEIDVADDRISSDDLAHLYLITEGGDVNFPLLNDVQSEIVRTEDANMLVQGVAGSGKTNVCVGKIVYCACRNYRGKVLYTTFSRGLLTETREKVRLFEKSIEDFILHYESGNIVFLDDDKQKAVENKLGILFRTGDIVGIVDELKAILNYLRNKVDYFLIEDLYFDLFDKKNVADERFFTDDFLVMQQSRLSGVFERIKNIQTEIVYKEIYGMIFGKYDPDRPLAMMSREEYIEARSDSFTRQECEAIYYIAQEYSDYLVKAGYVDNNSMSRELIGFVDSPLYSVAVIDEVQDFTQVNLSMLKALSSKMFCVGDALQMINPSYFNFAYLKRLMYGDITGVTELKHNYRSTEKIENIATKLGELNISRFGTHSFVLKGESVSSTLDSSAIFINGEISDKLTDEKFENVTVIVASDDKKRLLRQTLSRLEILTVAEAKGLERNTVILIDVLSDNADRWDRFERTTLNRKTADENSVFRYYFNMFYVGVSRARQHLFVSEKAFPRFFASLFDKCFDKMPVRSALSKLGDIAGRIELDDSEFIRRIDEFCSLGQYENARFAANRLSTDELRAEHLVRIDVHERYLRYGNYRDAGIAYWRAGMDGPAREMFTRSGDEALFPLMDACKQGSGALDVGIVKYLPSVSDNELAKKLIFETISRDYDDVMRRQRDINDIFKSKRKKK